MCLIDVELNKHINSFGVCVCFCVMHIRTIISNETFSTAVIARQNRNDFGVTFALTAKMCYFWLFEIYIENHKSSSGRLSSNQFGWRMSEW